MNIAEQQIISSSTISDFATTTRKPELDVLRGLAIILVLLRHSSVNPFLTNMGWIGVDLFFVLSGFLVSGLLFNEYQKKKSVNSLRFLVRRGFKIYPMYYFFVAIYTIPLLVTMKLSSSHLLGDLTFTQNYVSGWGYTFAPSWSLAVEEHFYILLALGCFIVTKKTFSDRFTQAQLFLKKYFVIVLASVMVIIFVIRIISASVSSDMVRLTTMTHLRIDALLAGVLISYAYHLHKEKFGGWIGPIKNFFPWIGIAALSFTPFLDPITSRFVITIGFSLTWFGFGLILIWLLYMKQPYQKISRYIGTHFASALKSVGTWSYAIYLVHTLINTILRKIHIENPFIFFILGTALSIFIGWLLTRYFENFFLSLRERIYTT
jgi:peptidoglycan/LPS O-acetylase OafA/YrhL